MKTDLYTKIVLTVIAVVLTINLLTGTSLVTPARADNPASVPIATPSPLMTQREGVVDVNIVSLNGRSVHSGLDVNIKSQDISSYGIPVQIKGVSTYSDLPVKVTNYRDFK